MDVSHHKRLTHSLLMQSFLAPERKTERRVDSLTSSDGRPSVRPWLALKGKKQLLFFCFFISSHFFSLFVSLLSASLSLPASPHSSSSCLISSMAAYRAERLHRLRVVGGGHSEPAVPGPITARRREHFYCCMKGWSGQGGWVGGWGRRGAFPSGRLSSSVVWRSITPPFDSSCRDPASPGAALTQPTTPFSGPSCSTRSNIAALFFL